ncbi:MAG: hypothetical protein AMJ66_01985 [Betaproteobacteria bacterium SG8_40]|jgi:general secretion pathway protein J|nr:MAG: hypothetical protein AMJ66_01985 [Betaproteobacteria bacterium SG8_40]
MTGKRPCGFTLVEMLVAVSLVGLLGVIAWRGLDHVIDQRERISLQDAQVERLIRTIAQIERDIDERVADALLVGPTEVSAALPRSMAIVVDEQSRQRITILRRHPVGPGTVRASYSLDDDRLIRASVSQTYEQPDRIALLDGIAGFRTRLLSQQGWVDIDAIGDSRALAIEISIERVSGERYTKVMPL